MADLSGGAFDTSPGELLGPGKNVVVGFETATALLRALYRPGGPRASTAGFRFVSAFDDAVRAAVARSEPGRPQGAPGDDDATREAYWARWLDGVRDAWLAISEAYWNLIGADVGAVGVDERRRVAAGLTETLKWNACDRFGPDAVLWSRLSSLLNTEPGMDARAVINTRTPGLAVEYVRAVACHAAQLDRLALHEAVVVAHLIDLCLPWVDVTRSAGGSGQYVMSTATAPVPSWQVSPDGSAEWHFMPWVADRLLADMDARVADKRVPHRFDRGTPELYRASLAHLRRLWSQTPPSRQDSRHPMDATLAVACGVDECRQIVRDGGAGWRRQWAAVDASRTGISMLAPSTPGLSWADLGELLGFLFTDSGTFHLGIVRRFRIAGDWKAEYGVQTMSRCARVVEAFDGQHVHQVLLCDEIISGQMLRLVSLPAALARGVNLRVAIDGATAELQPVNVLQKGQGFEIRAYRAA